LASPFLLEFRSLGLGYYFVFGAWNLVLIALCPMPLSLWRPHDA
jgi:hypothetical protein